LFKPPLLFSRHICLIFYLIALLEPLHASGGIYYSALPGEKRVAFTAQLNLQLLPGGAGGKGIATGTNDSGIIIILGMNLFLHVV